MDSAVIGILIAVGAGIWAFFTGYLMYVLNKNDVSLHQYKEKASKDLGNVSDDLKVTQLALNKDIVELQRTQTAHDNKFTTDSDVRNIFREAVRILERDVATVKGSVELIADSLTGLTVELRVQNKLRELQKGGNDVKNSNN
jgi:hypothetical protein